MIDLDPQGNASTGLGVVPSARSAGTYAVLTGAAALGDAIQRTIVPGLQVLPTDGNLAALEIELAAAAGREYRLKSITSDPALPYDVVLIDCPPSLGLLTLNALTAAHAVLVPLQCEFFALEGLSQLTATIARVQAVLNPNLRLHGIVLTMYDRRNNLSEAVATDARTYFGDRVYATVIPRNIRVSEAPSHGKPVLLYDFKSPGAQAYVHLAAEVLTRERLFLTDTLQ